MTKRPLRLWIAALLPVLLYAGGIFVLSAQSHLPETKVPDKVAHLAEYTVFGFLIARALYLLVDRSVVWAAFAAVVIATAFGATDEVHQFFVPGRDSSGWDLLADFCGSILGASIYAGLVLELAGKRSSSAES